MRGRLKGLKLVKLRYIVDRSGCDGVLENGVGFASVGLDGSLGTNFRDNEFSDRDKDCNLEKLERWDSVTSPSKEFPAK